MARRLDKEKVLKMRIEQEVSYSQIKAVTGICKSTLSEWLRDYPLSPERITELNAASERRIEKCRNSKRLKKENRLKAVYAKVLEGIGVLTEREIFIAGIFLYWGEGDKTGSTVSVSNTDPGIIRFFIKWLKLFDIETGELRCRFDLYKDMDIEREVSYWRNFTSIPVDRFKVTVKDSTLIGLTYKNGFGHGTCKVMVYRKDIFEYIFMGLKFLRDSV